MKECKNCLYCNLDSWERKQYFKSKSVIVNYVKNLITCMSCSWSIDKKNFVSNSLKFFRMGGEK